jgi:hypothetical protein
MDKDIGASADASANREHKDSLFAFIFGEKETALELYCAITGKKYGPDVKVEMAMLENPLYNTLMNDVSFTINDKLVVLVEHQSTICLNMPLRMLLYIARWYERYTKESDIYRRKAIPIPRPEFIVLYNGEADMPSDAMDLNLADSYLESGDICLNLKVQVRNINKGHNPEFARQSPTLNGYETFTAIARECVRVKKMTLEEALDTATEECIKSGLLVKYLKLYRTEVRNMWATEWKMEDALEIRAKEAWEDGLEEGLEKGLEKGKMETAEKMLAEGFDANTISRISGLSVEAILRLKQLAR